MKKLLVAVAALLVLGALAFFGLKARDAQQLHQAAQAKRPDAKSLPLAEVRIKAGGEKMGFVKNPQVQKILLDDWHLQVTAEKAGSVEMMREPVDGFDGLWPASDYCRGIFDERARVNGMTGVKHADVFSSPLVVMSWPPITDAFMRKGIVRQDQGTYYIVDMPRLVELVEKKTKWGAVDSSLSMLYGTVNIKATDPTKSNSGSMFMGLLANIMNGGEVCPPDAIDGFLPRLRSISQRMGRKEDSSGDIFNHFMSQGMGAYPLMVVYENQFLEALSADQGRTDLRTQVRVLYPQPTVWATHPFVALNKNGARLMEALQDPRIQRIAWEQHGFRSASPGVMNDPEVFKVKGVPRQVTSVVPTPEWGVMDKITEALTTTSR